MLTPKFTNVITLNAQDLVSRFPHSFYLFYLFILGCYAAYGSIKEDTPPCGREGCGGTMNLLRYNIIFQ